MANKTQENLARIRACDAEWNENDHPRADNGQFTSGSGGGGVKISKFKGQSGKVKAEREKAYNEQVETQKKIDSLNSKLENSPEYRQANRNASLGTGQTRIAGEEERARLKKEADKELDPLREQWRNAYAKQRSLANKVGGKFTTKQKSVNEAIKKHEPQMKSAMNAIQKADNEAANTEGRYYRAFNRLNKAGKENLGFSLLERHDQKQDAIKQKRQQALEKYNRALGKEMTEINNVTKKERAAKATLANARPKIAAMRQLAQAAKPAQTDANQARQDVQAAVNKHLKEIKSNFAAYPDSAKKLTKETNDLFKQVDKAGKMGRVAELLKRKEKIDAEGNTKKSMSERAEWFDNLSKEDKSLASVNAHGVMKLALSESPAAKPAQAAGGAGSTSKFESIFKKRAKEVMTKRGGKWEKETVYAHPLVPDDVYKVEKNKDGTFAVRSGEQHGAQGIQWFGFKKFNTEEDAYNSLKRKVGIK